MGFFAGMHSFRPSLFDCRTHQSTPVDAGSRMVAAPSLHLCAGRRPTRARSSEAEALADCQPSFCTLAAQRQQLSYSLQETAALCIAHLADSQWENAAQLAMANVSCERSVL